MQQLIYSDHSIANFDENAVQNKLIIAAIDQGLTDFNRDAARDALAAPLVIAIRDESGKVLGGVLGRSAYAWMRLDVVWLSESLRGQGHGRRLLNMVQQIAVSRACLGIHLDTHGFQAPAFYLQLGFEIFAELNDYPPGQKLYYLKKRLVSAHPEMANIVAVGIPE